MNTDAFTNAARAEAERLYRIAPQSYLGLMRRIAEWARDYLAAQEPTDEEVLAAAKAIYLFEADYHTEKSWERETATSRVHYLTYSRAALRATRDVRGQG